MKKSICTFRSNFITHQENNASILTNPVKDNTFAMDEQS